ncbi:hypothetical protein [Xenorhabdus sp. KJ12.1]|uniref:hypothetical protein n=1 Tax=Xenorhabdus sp. KJ12.1 TaxID=1851571 RepID=UPI000C03F13C|nr:hypothetical protein [Xenorhabdus sp. KJ12.1]PHM68610.1 136 kda insecticidal crystal protein-like protein [Xenorhabdus sp. KJ12.1]
MAARSVTVILQNETNFTLRLNRHHVGIDNGEWSTDFYPPGTILAKSQGVFETQSNAFGNGTGGHVRYNIMDNKNSPDGQGNNWVDVAWYNPYWGSNVYNQGVSDTNLYDVIKDPNTGSDYNATVRFYLSMKEIL